MRLTNKIIIFALGGLILSVEVVAFFTGKISFGEFIKAGMSTFGSTMVALFFLG